MTNHADSEYVLIGQGKKLKKWQISNTSDKPHTSKTLQKKKSVPGSEQPGTDLEKNKERHQHRQLPISLKKQVINQCVLQTMNDL